MVVQMTRAEYEKKYGTSPAASSTPVKMTRAEYDAKYGTPSSPNVLDRLRSAYDERTKNVQASKDAYAKGEQGLGRTILQAGGQFIGAGLDTIVKGVPGLEGLLGAVSKPIAAGVEKAADKLSETKFIKEAAAASDELPIERDLKAGQEYLNLLPGPKGVGAARAVLPKIAEGASETVRMLTTQSEKQIESGIVKKYERGVKPLLPGKTTPAKISDYRDDVVTAVRTIKENQSSLSFTDDAGEAVTGHAPRTLQQLSDAVEQTKKAVYTKYDALARQAGEAGVKVPMESIADELDVVTNSRALSITNPRAIQYAQDLKDRLSKAGQLDATTAQEVLQNYNKSLEAFYRNPSYDTASQAAIDALVANRLRRSLDDGISGLTGQQYQQLKNQYGALKTIERDVIKAALRDARKNTKGLIDFTDILSGGQVLNGILSLNPATIAQGVGAKAIAEFYKYLNNPNRAVEQMFKAADKLP